MVRISIRVENWNERRNVSINYEPPMRLQLVSGLGL